MTKKVYVFSRGKFALLEKEFLEGKAIIRIHNVNDEKWYESDTPNGIVFFFNDLRENDLTIWDKLKAQYGNGRYKYFTKYDCLKMCEFIKQNQEKDFIIHCEYGRSRSVAVASYMKDKFGFSIENKSPEEINKANDWMIRLFLKYHKAI